MSPEEKREYHRKWEAERRKDPAWREKRNELRREWRRKNPDKARELSRVWRRKNQERVLASQRERYRKNPEKARAYSRANVQTKYGLTIEQRDALLAAQGGVCAVCRKARWPKNGPDTDHCHATDRVRGILCNRCNTTLGRLGDCAAGVLAWSHLFLNYLNGGAK